MNRPFFFILILAFWTVGCTKSEKRESKSDSYLIAESLNQIECIPALDAQVISDLPQIIQGKGKVKKTGIYDLILPSNLEELKKLNAMAILAVRVYSHTSSDLPISKVVVIPKDPKGITEVLPKIFKMNTLKTVPSKRADHVLGDHYSEGYYFIPIQSLRKSAELSAVLSNGMTGLTIAQFPIQLESNFLEQEKNLKHNESQPPNPELVTELIKRRHCW